MVIRISFNNKVHNECHVLSCTGRHAAEHWMMVQWKM